MAAPLFYLLASRRGQPQRKTTSKITNRRRQLPDDRSTVDDMQAFAQDNQDLINYEYQHQALGTALHPGILPGQQGGL